MAAEKTYRRIIPVSQYDIAGMETWLSSMAEKGFFLTGLGTYLGRFRKAEPRPVRYRLEPAGKDGERPNPELYDIYKENGWRYITSLGATFYVFMAEDAASPEIHTDPLVQSETLKKIIRRLILSLTVAFVFLPLLFVLSVPVFRPGGDWVGRALLEFNMNLYVALPIYIIMGIGALISTARLINLRRRLRAGKPFEHRRNYKRGIVLRIMELVVAFTAVFALAALLIVQGTMGFTHQKPLSEATPGMPVLSLAEIDSGQHEDYYDAFFYRKYTPLVPKQYIIRMDDPYTHLTVLQTNFYKTALSCLSEPVFDELSKIYGTFYEIPTDSRPLDTPLFDKATYIQTENAQFVIAYRGRTVIAVRYIGEEYLPDKLELIADVFL